MENRRSYLDTLNVGRARRPQDTLQQLSQSLQQLERQLAMREPRAGGYQQSRRGLADAATPPAASASTASTSAGSSTQDPITGELDALRAALFDRLEKDGAALHRRPDATVTSPPGALPAGELAGIKAQIERLSDTVGEWMQRADDRPLNVLRLELEQARAAIESLAREDSVRSIGERWEGIERRMHLFHEHLATDLDQSRSLAAIESRLDEISQAIVASASSAPTDDQLRRLEARMGVLSRRLEGIRLEPDADDRPLLAAVDKRFAELSDRIDGLIAGLSRFHAQMESQDGDLRQVAPRLDRLEKSIAANCSLMIDAAREAAEQVANALPAAARTEIESASGLADDLKQLASLMRRADERNAKSFEAIHDTLLKIVGRFGSLEQGNATPASGSPAGIEASERDHFEERLERARSAAVERANDAARPKESWLSGLSRAFRRKPSTDEIERPAASVPTGDGLAPEPEIPTPTPAAVSAPDLTAIMRRLRDDRPLGDPRDSAAGDFLAAARRSTGTIQDSPPAEEAKAGSGSIAHAVRVYRAPMMLAMGAVGFTLLGLQMSGLHLKDAPELTGDKAPSRTEGVRTTKRTEATRPTQQAKRVVARPDTQTPALVVPVDVGPESLRTAAAAGDSKALFAIGANYAFGNNVQRDLKRAAAWYQKAADRGFAPAQYRLGNMYERGDGVVRDVAKAKALYRLAAHRGNARAMHNLAVLLISGPDGAADSRLAVYWFNRAADLGTKDSQFNLGILAARGVGMSPNLEQSYKWFALAAKAGDSDAAARRDEVGESLRPDQVQRARDLIDLWRPKDLQADANATTIPADWQNDPAIVTENATAGLPGRKDEAVAALLASE